MSALEGIRLSLGALFISLLPGLAWSFVLFRRRSIDWLERTAISFGLSIALVPATVFWLYWLFDVGISLLTVTLVASALTVFPAAYLTFQQRQSCLRLLTRLRGLRRTVGRRPATPPDSSP